MRYARMLVAAALLTLGVGAFSRLSYTPPDADNAVLRLSWRMSVSGERCRDRTQQELEALPVHMRAPRVCERDDAHYIMVTRIDEATADTVDLLQGGMKADRPLFVLQDRELPPGLRRVRVSVDRLGGVAGATVPAALDTTVEMVPGRVVLVTLDAGGHRLIVQ